MQFVQQTTERAWKAHRRWVLFRRRNSKYVKFSGRAVRLNIRTSRDASRLWHLFNTERPDAIHFSSAVKMERSSAPVRRVTKTARTNARRRSQLSDAVRAELLVGDDAGIDDVGDTQTIAATGDGADGGGGGGGDDDPHGDGLGSFLRSAGRKVMFTAKRSVSKITTAAARAITAALPKVTSFSTKQRAYIRDYGPGRVTGIRVFRVPLDAILNVAI